jgi:site-specific DNA-methyltransferase (adenine-specific)
MIDLDTITNTDLFTLCDGLPDASIDMILCDLPYGTTACSWDTVIPFAPMWERFKRVIKPRGAIVLTASQPFTSALVMSNVAWFRCEWIWRKPQGTGYLNANRQPMKNHESAVCFAEGEHNYYPQMRKGEPYVATSGNVGGFVRDKSVGGYVTINLGERFPLTVLDYNAESGLHPTQKPVALFRYLIRTYTQPGEVVLDPCVGSGTTALAAQVEGRHFICGDTDADYCEIARARLQGRVEEYKARKEGKPYTLPLFEAIEA